MCGIAGGIGKNLKSYLISHLHLLDKRGPDSNGILEKENGLILGATRLAMTDPHPRSDQPMQDLISQNIITFNGEIYNFLKIKEKLYSDGKKFNTESDTEVALLALTYFGINAVKDFEGMFAFGFYNKNENCLYLGRDYLGKKPLYYAYDNDFFIYSSQINLIKGFLKKLTLDRKSLSNYLRFGYLLSPETMYEEIKSVQPGEIIKIDLNLKSDFSRFRFTPNALIYPKSMSVRDSLSSATFERVRGHKNVAISLSGGIDSTIVALEAKSLGVNCKAFTLKWEDSDKSRYNEDFKSATLIAKSLNMDLIVIDGPKTYELRDKLTNYLMAMGEPNSNPTGISMLSLYSAISKDNIRLTLTGDGSDEIFAGYERYNKIKKLQNFPTLLNKELYSKFFAKHPKNKINLKYFLPFMSANDLNFWSFFQQLANNEYLSRFFPDYHSRLVNPSEDEFYQRLVKTNSKVAQTMLKDLRIWLTMESNNKLDRISMNFSVEARSPFQSENVISSGIEMMKKVNYKMLNKSILTQQYPELLSLSVNRQKLGFMSPLGHWLRNNNNLIQDSCVYLKRNFDFDKKELEKLSRTATLGDYKNFRFLWNLIVLAEWHRLDKQGII